MRVNDYIVKVTGTSFNVTSYTDDPCTMTTLVEGKVSVYGNDSTWNCDLTPGHMLKFDKGTARVTSEEVIREFIPRGLMENSSSGI